MIGDILVNDKELYYKAHFKDHGTYILYCIHRPYDIG